MENVTFTLNNGVKMPAAGLGVFQVTDRKQCIDAVICAIENGYRMIDTAAVYGNEEAVGEAVRLCGVRSFFCFVVPFRQILQQNGLYHIGEGAVFRLRIGAQPLHHVLAESKTVDLFLNAHCITSQ